MKIKKRDIIIISLLVIFFLVSYIIYLEYGRINIPSKCHTNLQSSKYFSEISYMGNEFPVKIDENKDIFIKNKEKKDIFVHSAIDTGSMRPAIPDYAILIFIKVNENDIKIGDIVSIKRINKSNLLHRVVDITGDGFYITKGDNNVNSDKQSWTFEQINGKLVGVLW